MKVPVPWFLKRAVIEAPFVVLAFLLPIFGTDPRTDFLGLSLSVEGSLAGWNILVKGTLGVLISLTLAATTAPGDLLKGLQTLKVPAPLIMIATLMLRYGEVVVGEAKRMRVARISRRRRPGSSGRRARPRAQSAHCSSGPTNAERGCASRWCRAAGRAVLEVPR